MPLFFKVPALDSGHITLPKRLFVTNADPEKRATVPSLAFLIQHPSPSTNGSNNVTSLVFDLGVKRDLNRYTPAQREHVTQRQPVITDPDCAASLRNSQAPLNPTKDIDLVILSHVHWDHVRTPSDFASATFVVGSGTLNVLKNGAGPLFPAALFNDDELPACRTVEFPPVPGDSPSGVPRHTPTPTNTQATLPSSASTWAWQPHSGFPAAIVFFDDGSLYVIDSPGHLYGHLNLLARVGQSEYIFLGGDSCHDPRILTGEKRISLYDDGRGGIRSVLIDTGVAQRTLDWIREFMTERRVGGKEVTVEVVVAHDAAWRERNRHRFWPGRCSRRCI
jgi:glyoxylase-like metal-dependent hydrolase (beta-lactamase superfamily II)